MTTRRRAAMNERAARQPEARVTLKTAPVTVSHSSNFFALPDGKLSYYFSLCRMTVID